MKSGLGFCGWLAGSTSLPVYHDHPHKRDQILKNMPNDLGAQARATMDGIKQTLEAAGVSFQDVVHVFVFRTRPRMGDIGAAAFIINSYFAPFNHKPTSTNMIGPGAGRAVATDRDSDGCRGGLTYEYRRAIGTGFLRSNGGACTPLPGASRS